ncbi:hypothetical protein OG592_06075 [Streptomyces avidinii]|nr:hypothetical protein OG592_06075 [Streptomyces avidinii]
MSDLDALLVQRHQPVPGQGFEHEGGVRARVRLVPGDPAPGVLRTVAQSRQPQEQRPGEIPLYRRQRQVCGLGGLRERVLDAARGLVPVQGQPTAAAAAPGLDHRMGDQRQRPRLTGRVRDHRGQQRAGHRAPGEHGRPRDDLAQLLTAHRTDRDLRVAHRLDQVGVLDAVAVEIGAHTEHDPGPAGRRRAGRDQQGDERVALVPVPAEGEDLLELVDHDQRVDVRRAVDRGLPDPQVQRRRIAPQLGQQRAGWFSRQGGQADRALLHGVGTRREEHHRPPRRPRAGDEPRPQQRGLPRSGGPEDRQEPALTHLCQHLARQPLAPEEAVGVLRLERRQPRVRRPLQAGFRALDAGCADGDLRGDRVPSGLPCAAVAPAGRHVRQRDAQARERAPAGGVRQRRGRVVRPLGQGPIRRPSRRLAQCPQVGREPRQRTGVQVERAFGAWHGRPFRSLPQAR